MQAINLADIHSTWAMRTFIALFLVSCTEFAFGSLSAVHAGWMTELPQKDRQAVLDLLRTTKFDRLNVLYDGLQRQYESGLINDRDLTLKYQPFYDTSSKNESFLNQWVEMYPKSYPARLARGIYYTSVGEERRGEDFIQNTPDEKIQDLHRYLDLSNRDVVDSLSLTAKPIVSLLQLLKSSRHYGDNAIRRQLLEQANRIDPNNYGLRRQYMMTLRPRWGGSYDEMWAFLNECRDQHLPAEYLRIFESRIYLDQAQVLCCEQHQPEKGQALYRKVVAMLDGLDIPDKLEALEGIIRSRGKSQSLVEFLPEVEAILRIRPDDKRSLGNRAWIHFQQGRYQEGMNDYTKAAQLGDAYSQFQLGKQLYYGRPPLVANHAQGLYWIKQAAEQGNDAAKQFLAQVKEIR